jgi:hypothetical protein
MSSSSDSGSRSRRGLIATALALAAAAGVVVAAAIDSAGGGAASTAGAASSARTTTTTPRGPSYFDQLNSLPRLTPGELPGRVLVSNLGCDLVWTDLATLHGTPAQSDVRECLRGQDQVESNPGSGWAIVRAPDGSVAAQVPVPSGWFLDEQTMDGFVLCSYDGRQADFVRYRGGRRRLPECPAGVIDGQLVFPRGRMLVDERGRTVLRFRHAFDNRHVLRQLSSGTVIVESLGSGPTDLYASGRYRGSVPIKQAGDRCSVSSVSRDATAVLGQCPPGGAMVVFRNGEPHPVNPLLASTDVLMSPDGKWLLVHVPAIAYAVVVDAVTLAPRYRLPLTQAAALLDWRE